MPATADDLDTITHRVRSAGRLSVDGACVSLAGDITVHELGGLVGQIDALDPAGITHIDLAEVGHLDTAGAWAILRLQNRIKTVGKGAELSGATPRVAGLIQRVADAAPKAPPSEAWKTSIKDRLETVGRAIASAAVFLAEVMAMLGIFLARLAWLLRHPGEFRLTALVHHAHQVGWKAIPIVSLMGFLIGVVLAYQGSVQLRQFGAEIFVVDLIAISILRELGILLTAIIVAGRTASSFTAAIGSMKMREEIDAMRTLAIDPAVVLFVPRILALLITLPILGLIANITGLFGGAIMSWIELGISPAMFFTRLIEDTSVDHVLVGFVKAPVFAIIIGVVGCHAGMRVGGNAESLGRMTSAAVVTAIFSVIVADALFSVFFAMMEI